MCGCGWHAVLTCACPSLPPSLPPQDLEQTKAEMAMEQSNMAAILLAQEQRQGTALLARLAREEDKRAELEAAQEELRQAKIE